MSTETAKTVLIVGGGGREHALAWKAAQSADVDCVYVAPGNAGTALEDKVRNVDIAAEAIDELLVFACSRGIDLTIVGPEVPLVEGIVDRFNEQGMACFGPTAAAARLEGSKSFAKAFMEKYGIPTAGYQEFTEHEPALSYLQSANYPIVVKADGLAAGKGVIIAENQSQAEQAARGMLSDASFGDAGKKIVIEDFLQGEEASFIVITDGETALPMASSQDHKARDNGDKGPNTGGMGAYTPAPIVSDELSQRVMDEVIQPVLDGLRAENMAYTGFLYAGLMISPEGDIQVLEFNCRFGDPETQPIMLRLESDLTTLCQAALVGELANCSVQWDKQAAIGVVLAAIGYPESYQKGEIISGLATLDSDKVKVFHAGTKMAGNLVTSHGGRVLCVVAKDLSLASARDMAYATIEKIDWPGGFCRTDIGYRALDRDS